MRDLIATTLPHMPTRGEAKARRAATLRTAGPVTRDGLASRAHEGLHPTVAKHFDLFERGSSDGALDSTVLAFIASSKDPVCTLDAEYLVRMLRNARTRAAEAKFRRWLHIDRAWKNGRGVMWQAASHGLAAIIVAWQALGADVESPDANGITALHIAVLRKQYDAAQALLRLGARPTSRVLVDAIYTTDVSMVQALVDGGADMSQPYYEASGTPVFPLTAAARANKHDVLQYCVDRGATLHASRAFSINALNASMQGASAATVRFLIDKVGIDPGTPHSAPPLFVACLKRNTEAVEELLRDPARVNIHTALRAAIEYNCQEAFEELLRLLLARPHACESCTPVRCLLNQPETTATSYVYTARAGKVTFRVCHSTAQYAASVLGCAAPPHFMLAIVRNRVAMVQHMLELGASPSLRDCPIRAAGVGALRVLEMLLDAGADKDQRSACGRWTPLSAAAASGHVHVLEALHRLGVNSTHYHEALYHAVYKGHVRAAACLVRLGVMQSEFRAILAGLARRQRWGVVHKMAHLAGSQWGSLALLHQREIAWRSWGRTRLGAKLADIRHTRELAKLREELRAAVGDAAREREECIVCMEARRSEAFVPCGHRCMCATCARSIMHTTRQCPECRGAATACITVYG